MLSNVLQHFLQLNGPRVRLCCPNSLTASNLCLLVYGHIEPLLIRVEAAPAADSQADDLDLGIELSAQLAAAAAAAAHSLSLRTPLPSPTDFLRVSF